MSVKEQSLSISFMSTHWPSVITFVFCVVPCDVQRGNPSPWAKYMRGVFTTQAPVFCPVIGHHKTCISLKPDTTCSLPSHSTTPKKECQWVCVRDNQSWSQDACVRHQHEDEVSHRGLDFGDYHHHPVWCVCGLWWWKKSRTQATLQWDSPWREPHGSLPQ